MTAELPRARSNWSATARDVLLTNAGPSVEAKLEATLALAAMASRQVHALSVSSA